MCLASAWLSVVRLQDTSNGVSCSWGRFVGIIAGEELCSTLPRVRASPPGQPVVDGLGLTASNFPCR